MKASKLKWLAAAVAATIAVPSMADMTIGDDTIMLNLIDTDQGIGLIFDTGLKVSTFDATTNHSFDLSGDAEFQAFASKAGTDLTTNADGAVQFDVIGINTISGVGEKIFTTARLASFSPTNTNSATAAVLIRGQYVPVNGESSPTTNSLFVSSSSDPAYWGASDADFSSSLGFGNQTTPGDDGIVGASSPLAFYSITVTGTGGSASKVKLSGTWQLTSAGELTFATAVPLPPSVYLLLCGLLGIGVLGRRAARTGIPPTQSPLAR